MELRPYHGSDETACAAWFREDDLFMPSRWLGAALAATRRSPENHFLFVGCENAEPVSIISISRVPAGDRAVVSLLVAPNRRRTGVARAMLEAVRDAFPEVDEFVAYVDPKNDPTLGLLKGLRLVPAPYTDLDKELFVWRRDGTSPPPGWQPSTIP